MALDRYHIDWWCEFLPLMFSSKIQVGFLGNLFPLLLTLKCATGNSVCLPGIKKVFNLFWSLQTGSEVAVCSFAPAQKDCSCPFLYLVTSTWRVESLCRQTERTETSTPSCYRRTTREKTFLWSCGSWWNISVKGELVVLLICSATANCCRCQRWAVA